MTLYTFFNNSPCSCYVNEDNDFLGNLIIVTFIVTQTQRMTSHHTGYDKSVSVVYQLSDLITDHEGLE